MIVYLQNYICLYIAHCEFWLPQPTRWLTATAGRQKQGFCRSVRAHIVLTKVTVLALCCRHIVCWFSSQRDYGNQMDYGDGDNGSWYFPPQLLLLTVTELKTAAQKKERLFCETKNSASERLARTCAEAASACCSCCCSCFLRSWSWCSSEEEASAAGRASVEVTRMGELSRREGPSDTCGTRRWNLQQHFTVVGSHTVSVPAVIQAAAQQPWSWCYNCSSKHILAYNGKLS